LGKLANRNKFIVRAFVAGGEAHGIDQEKVVISLGDGEIVEILFFQALQAWAAFEIVFLRSKKEPKRRFPKTCSSNKSELPDVLDIK
jgi:hypothetical protein